MRAFAVITAVVGLVIFLILYFRMIEGHIQEALSNPRTIAVILLPFLPAIVVSWLAERAQTRFIDFLQSANDADAPAAPEQADKNSAEQKKKK